MAESQKHGFTFENEVLKAYGLDPTALSYTRAHDIPAELNSKEGQNVSIKTTGGKSVDMGDILRIFQETSPAGDSILLTVLFYEQDDDKKKLKQIIQVDLTGAQPLLFGTVIKEELHSSSRAVGDGSMAAGVTAAELQAYVASVKAIPHGQTSAEQRAAYKSGAAALNAKMGFLQVRPKVDSKSQRRVQCSFPDFQAFCTAHPDRVKSKIINGILHGHQLPLEIDSGRRLRH